MSMLPPRSHASSRHSTPGTPARRLSGLAMAMPLSTPTRRVSLSGPSSASSTPASATSSRGSFSGGIMQTPGSLASSSSLSSSTTSHRRRSLHRRTPKANEPLARIASAASTVIPLARTPEEISASYEQWMKLAADNKINASNSWHLGLIDYFADMRILKEGDGGINFQKASCTLDGCVKIYSTRVDAVASETEVLVSGLNDAKQAAAHAAAAAAAEASGDWDHDDLNDESQDAATLAKAAERRAKRAARKANMKTLEKDFAPITTAAIDVEFMIDPLFRKTCAEFDEGGADSLLLSRLTVGGLGQIIFDSSGVVENAGHANGTLDHSTAEKDKPGVDLSQFKSLANVLNTDLHTKSMCPTLATFALSDEMRGVESLTQVLELDLLDELSSQIPQQPAPFFAANQPQSHDDRAHDDDAAVDTQEVYVPLTLPPTMPLSTDDFYSEANLFADDDDDDDDDDQGFEDVGRPDDAGALPHPGGSAPSAAPAPASELSDDQFLLLPLPRSRGVLASATAASNRLALLRTVRTAKSASARKPPATIDFLATPAPRYEDVFAKGGSGINLPRATLATGTGAPGAQGAADAGGVAAMSETTSLELHIATDPFDEHALARSSLKPRGVFPRGLAGEVKARGGVARMVEILGGVPEAEEKTTREEEDRDEAGADLGAGADWDVEAPVLDDGEQVPLPPPSTQPAPAFGEDDMAMDADVDGGVGFVDGPGGRMLDPIVAEDLERRGMDADDMPPPVFDLTIDATALGGGFLGTAPPASGGIRAGSGLQLISAFTQHMAGGSSVSAMAPSSQFRRNRMALNFAKRSKRVDVKKLKENIWRTIRRGAVLDLVADPDAAAGEHGSDENKKGKEPSEDKSTKTACADAEAVASKTNGGELAFQDVVKQVGQQYSSDQFKDISVPFCFICVLHLANEKNLKLEAKGMSDLLVKAADA